MSRIKLRINKTKNGTEFLGVDFTDNKGKRQRKSLGLKNTPENKKQAENVIIPKLTLALEEQKGEFFKNKIPTVGEYMPKSIDMHRAERNQITHDDYLSIYKNHIQEIFGKKKLDEIKPSDIRQWQSDLSIIKELSHSRIRTIRVLMVRMFKDAIDDGIIEKNPVSSVPALKIKKSEIQPFTLNEMTKIISTAEGQLQNFVATAFLTGARSGELIGLKWEDIDFEKREISIERSIKNGIIGNTKNEYSIRTIDMLDSLIPYLESQYKLTGSKNSYVFLNPKGDHFYDIKRIREPHWKKLLEKCEIPYKTIYYTRHTFATLMVENEDILWVSQMLGHKDSTVTLQKYAKYMKKPEIKRGSFLNNSLSVVGSHFGNQNKKVA